MEIKLTRSNLEIFLSEIENEYKELTTYLNMEQEKYDDISETYRPILSRLNDTAFDHKMIMIKESIHQSITDLDNLRETVKYIKDALFDAIQKSARNLNIFDILNEVTDKYNEYLKDKSSIVGDVLKNTNLLQNFNKEIIYNLRELAMPDEEKNESEDLKVYKENFNREDEFIEVKEEDTKVETEEIDEGGKDLEQIINESLNINEEEKMEEVSEVTKEDLEKEEYIDETYEELERMFGISKLSGEDKSGNLDMCSILGQLKPMQKSVDAPKEVIDRDNRVLLISEKDGKVYLPYRYKNLERKARRYESVEKVIEEEYVLDISQFKNTGKARFREAYNLVRNKCKGSVIEATTLGLELMFNYKLHPAIIAACENQDELDTYLDYLECGELEKFNIFEVKYDIAPDVVVPGKRRRRA